MQFRLEGSSGWKLTWEIGCDMVFRRRGTLLASEVQLLASAAGVEMSLEASRERRPEAVCPAASNSRLELPLELLLSAV